MTVKTAPEMCTVYDQISDLTCRYYTGHGGKHNFARLDHIYALERELRRALDEMIAARDEACEIAATAFKMRGNFIGRRNKTGWERITELRKVGA